MRAFASRAGIGLVLFALACGRSQLYAGEPTASSGGRFGGGGAGGGASLGGASSSAGGGQAGRPGGRAGAGGGGGSLNGSAGAPQSCERPCTQDEMCVRGRCVCAVDQLQRRETQPGPAALDVDQGSSVAVAFNCALQDAWRDSQHARLYGGFNGYIPTSFPAAPRERLVLRPESSPMRPPYFAGELVTGWLDQPLAGPYLWQFVVAVGTRSLQPFRAAQALPSLDRARAVALGDLDGDADLDVVVEGNPNALLLRNEGRGTFAPAEPLPVDGEPTLADVDRDGDLDVAAKNSLTRNDGSGRYTAVEPLPGCVTFGDVDGDGDQDCLASQGYVASQPQGQVMFNNGRGEFSGGGGTPIGFDCDLWDLDRDGDLDAVCVSPVLEPVRILLNDGRGTFSVTTQVLGGSGTRGFGAGDLDSDGDVDVVVAQWFGAGRAAANQVWLNDGSGSFVEDGTVGWDGGDIELGDLDGDGDLDVVYSQLTPYGPLNGPFNVAVAYLNDGAAGFREAALTIGDPAYHWLELGDLDGDQDLDAFVFHQLGSGGNYAAVWLSGD